MYPGSPLRPVVVKAFPDTSVLVPVFYGDHERHTASRRLLEQYAPSDVGCSAHSLFEVYATLTGMPQPLRASPREAAGFVDDLRARLTLVALDAAEYVATPKAATEADVAGGAIYDALLGGCAVKAGGETLYTWNLRHFERLWPEVARRVRSPQAG